jgi:hypothetical protein
MREDDAGMPLDDLRVVSPSRAAISRNPTVRIRPKDDLCLRDLRRDSCLQLS